MLQTTFKSQILPFGFNPSFLVRGVFGFFLSLSVNLSTEVGSAAESKSIFILLLHGNENSMPQICQSVSLCG